MPSVMRTMAFAVAVRSSSLRSSVLYCAQQLQVGVTTFATVTASPSVLSATEEEEFDLADADLSKRIVRGTLLYLLPSAASAVELWPLS